MRSWQFLTLILLIMICLGLQVYREFGEKSQFSFWMLIPVLVPIVGMFFGAFLAIGRPMVTAVIYSLVMGATGFAGVAVFGGDFADDYVMGAIWITHWFVGIVSLSIGILAAIFPAPVPTRFSPN